MPEPEGHNWGRGGCQLGPAVLNCRASGGLPLPGLSRWQNHHYPPYNRGGHHRGGRALFSLVRRIGSFEAPLCLTAGWIRPAREPRRGPLRGSAGAGVLRPALRVCSSRPPRPYFLLSLPRRVGEGRLPARSGSFKLPSLWRFASPRPKPVAKPPLPPIQPRWTPPRRAGAIQLGETYRKF